VKPSLSSLRKTPRGYFLSRFGEPEYTSWLDESLSWKQAASLGDWSFLWQRRIAGAEALRLLADISVNSFANFAIGQAKHVIHCNRDGKVIHEGVVSRLGDREFMMHGRGGFWAEYNLRRGKYAASIEADDWFVFQLAGPRSLEILERATRADLRSIKFMHQAEIELAGHKVIALRQGMSGEVGFELQGPKHLGPSVRAALLECGADLGLRQIGGRAVMMNHLEACFPTIITDYLPAIFEDEMSDYLEAFKRAMPNFAQTLNVAGSFEAGDVSDYYRSPIELGWGRNIKFDHDFLGRDALAQEAATPRRVIRTLVWNSQDVMAVHESLYEPGEPYGFMDMPRDQRGFMWADKVMIGDRLVGVATSRGYSYFFRQMLSLCTLDIASAEIGTEVTVIWGTPGQRQMTIRARVERAPYKTDKRREDLSIR
jgi:vanillate/3-O-methylgallate O-demethylase